MSKNKATTQALKTQETAAIVSRDASNSLNPNAWAVTDYISKFDEVAKQRLDNINQKLRDLERQMEVLEAEMIKANDFERMVSEIP